MPKTFITIIAAFSALKNKPAEQVSFMEHFGVPKFSKS